MYRPRNRKGSAVRKGEEGEAETNVPERNEKQGGGGRRGKKEARRVIARDCTVARIIARAPEKRRFKFVHPPPSPLKNVLSPLCCARPFRSDLLNTPDTIFRTPIFRNTCHAFTSCNISSWPWNRTSSLPLSFLLPDLIAEIMEMCSSHHEIFWKRKSVSSLFFFFFLLSRLRDTNRNRELICIWGRNWMEFLIIIISGNFIFHYYSNLRKSRKNLRKI